MPGTSDKAWKRDIVWEGHTTIEMSRTEFDMTGSEVFDNFVLLIVI